MAMHDKKNWQLGRLWVYRRYATGIINSFVDSNLGQPIGTYCCVLGNEKIFARMLLAGPIDMGLEVHDVIVVPRKRAVFLGRGGKIWLARGVNLPRKCPKVGRLTRAGRRIWADTIVRSVVDSLVPQAIAVPLNQARTRYRHICRELAMKRVIDAAAHGREISLIDFAKGIGDWTTADLVAPKIPNVRHAILFSLVLSLDANMAADLIELAGFIEHKIPIHNRSSSLALYHSSVEMLAKLCPPWWTQGYMTNWMVAGTIERLFKAQFCRIMNDAWVREVPASVAAGIDMEQKLSDPSLEMVAIQQEGMFAQWEEPEEDLQTSLPASLPPAKIAD